jgi:hypothetical protein
MYASTVSDLDSLLLKCRLAVSRSYISEAVACIKVGSYRASIVVTWIAVLHDILGKLQELEAAGDEQATNKLEEFRRAIRNNNVQYTLAFERGILRVAREEFELLGEIAYVDLSRLQGDRNRCAHPSMVDEDVDYRPSPELARCHVVNAVEHLLQQAPVQGKVALKRLEEDLHRTYFPSTLDSLVSHLAHGPLANPRESLLRNFIGGLLKQVLDPPAQGATALERLRARSTWREHVDRCIRTLQAVAMLQRPAGLPLLHSRMNGFVERLADGRLGDALALVSSIDGCWGALNPAQRARIEHHVQHLPTGELGSRLESAWRVPALQDATRMRLSRMRPEDWESLSETTSPPIEWVELALRATIGATSFAMANSAAALLAKRTVDLTAEQLGSFMSASKENLQLTHSRGLRDVINALVQAERLDASAARRHVTELDIVGMYEALPWWGEPSLPAGN